METIAWNISIKSIFQNNRKLFQDNFSGSIRENSIYNVNKILQCGSWELGFYSYKCNECNEIKHIHFTCKSRFCNSCSKPQSDLWMNKIISRWPQWILYKHFTFTIPFELRDFFKRHRKALKILPYTAYWAIQYFLDKQKIKVWTLAVIHSFWSQLNRNPHTHLLVTASGLHESWKFIKKVYFPYDAIKTSRTKFIVKYLKERTKTNITWDRLKAELKYLNQFYNFTNQHWKTSNWYVDFWKKSRSFIQVIWYLGRYLKRPVIAQSRILHYDHTSVTFKYIDKRDQQSKSITCSPLEFIWLLLQHLPDRWFHMVYYYWLFANRCKKKYIHLFNTHFQHSAKIPIIPKTFSQRAYFFTWINPLLCPCWWVFCRFKITIPWYPVKFFDSW